MTIESKITNVEIDGRDYLHAVAETLERLQIAPEHLFPYVAILRLRLAACTDALLNIADFSDDDIAADLARQALAECGIKTEKDNEPSEE